MFTYEYGTKICPHCHQEYQATGYRQIYCKKCKPLRNKPREKMCDWCGSKFVDQSKNNTGKYCSDRCRHLARNEQAADWQSKYRMRERIALYGY